MSEFVLMPSAMPLTEDQLFGGQATGPAPWIAVADVTCRVMGMPCTAWDAPQQACLAGVCIYSGGC